MVVHAFFRMSQHLFGFPRILSLRIRDCVAFKVRHRRAGFILLAKCICKPVQRSIVRWVKLQRILITQISAAIIPILHVQIGGIQIIVDSSIRRLIACKGIQLGMRSEIALSKFGLR